MNDARHFFFTVREVIVSNGIQAVGENDIPRLDNYFHSIRVHHSDILHDLVRKQAQHPEQSFLQGEWIKPSTPTKTYLLFLHGGSGLFMSSQTHRNLTIPLSQHLNVIVLSIEYRLAPEHPFPGK